MKHTQPEPPYKGLYSACNVNGIPTPKELKGLAMAEEVIESKDLAHQHRDRDAVGLVHAGPASIATILQSAIDKGMDPAALTKLFDLYERVEGRDAAKEAANALSRFQEACPSVRKTSTAKIVTKSGSNYSYTYAKLDEIARTIRPHLAKEGLSYGWDSIEDANKVEVTCIVRHINGHTFTAKAIAPTDSESRMSGAQRNTAARTTAKRESLVQALGLTTCDDDTDGVEPGSGPGTVSEHQIANLSALILDVGADTEKVLKAYGVSQIKDLPAVNYPGICQALEAKRKGKA